MKLTKKGKCGMIKQCGTCEHWTKRNRPRGYGNCALGGQSSVGYLCDDYAASANMTMKRPNESERGWASLSVRPRLADDQPTEVTITVSVTRDDQQAITALLNAVRGCGFAVTDAETAD